MDEPITRLFLVRHGRVESAWVERLYGGLDVPLSELGRRQAERAAALLANEPLDAVVSSGLARTEHGAACIRRGRGLERRDEPALVELDRGAWAGLTRAELERREPGAWDAWWEAPHERRPPAGESLEDLAARVLPCVEALVRELDGGAAAIVSHSWVTRIVVAHVLGLGPAGARELDVPPGGVCALDWPSRWPLGEASLEPTLLGLNLDRAPERSRGWMRGPHRTPPPR